MLRPAPSQRRTAPFQIRNGTSPLVAVRQPLRFDPGQLFGPGRTGCWYDPRDLSTLFQDTAGSVPVTAVGQSVALILDKSGNGNHLVQATLAKQATWQSSGGVSWLQFDGIDDCYQTIGAFDLSAYGQLGLIVGFKPTSGATMVVAELGPNVNSTADTFYVAAANDPAAGQISMAVSDNSGAADGVATTASAYGSGVVSVISCQSLDLATASASARMPMRRNGASEPISISNDVGAAGTAFASGQVLNVGSRNAANFFLAGNFYGLIIRGGAFTPTELGGVEAWLLEKTVASAAAYNDNLTESAGAGDSVDPAGSTFGAPLSEAAQANDGFVSTANFASTLGESAAAAGSLTGGLLLAASLNEAAAANDGFTTAMTFAPAVSESAAANDNLAAQATFGGTLGESAGAADSEASSATMPNSLGESAVAADSLSARQTFTEQLNENAGANDAVSSSGATYNENVTESLAAAATLGVGLVLAGTLAETAAAGDQVAATADLGASLGEQAAAGDAEASQLAAGAQLGEAAVAGDEYDAMLTTLFPTGAISPARIARVGGSGRTAAIGAAGRTARVNRRVG